MSDFLSLETRIINEYGAIRGFIATHVYFSVFAALAIGFLVGKII